MITPPLDSMRLMRGEKILSAMDPLVRAASAVDGETSAEVLVREREERPTLLPDLLAPADVKVVLVSEGIKVEGFEHHGCRDLLWGREETLQRHRKAI